MRQLRHNFLFGGMLLISTAFTCVAHADAPVYNTAQYDADASAQTQAYNQDNSNSYAANASDQQADYQGNGQSQGNYQQPAADNNQDQNQGVNQAQQTIPAPNFNSQLTLDQRVAKLEQQVAHLNRANFNGQLQTMQQELQDLHGQLEVQAHVLAQLRQTNQTSGKAVSSAKTANSSLTDLSDNAAAVSGNKRAAKATDTKQATKQQAEAKAQTVTASNADFLQQQNTYESAYNFIKIKEYQKAIAAMKSYLLQYPNGQYAPNAHYWLGELYYIQNDIQASTTQFQTVVNNYPDNDKVADAKLKLGFIYFDNGQLGKAKDLLSQVAQKYPGTTVAQLAQSRLREIKRLGQ